MRKDCCKGCFAASLELPLQLSMGTRARATPTGQPRPRTSTQEGCFLDRLARVVIVGAVAALISNVVHAI
eukprot:3158673-Pyramimonas_sp.AAC.1